MRLIAVSILAITVSGCLSMSSMQSARTTKPGKVSAHIGLGSQGTKFTKKSDDQTERDLQDAIENLRVPVIEGGLRVGISDNFDVGGKLALLPGSLGIDAKYRIFGKGSIFAIATGLGADYGSFTLSSGSGEDEVSNSITITDVWVPLYMSLNFGESSAFYLSPRAVSRTTTNESKSNGNSDGSTSTPTTSESAPSEEKTSSTSTLMGAAIGLHLGWFGLEYSVLTGATDGAEVYLDQFTVGIRIASGNVE